MLRYNPNWCSYLPVLIKAVQISEGPVLELGSGPFSTPVMHWLCFDAGRHLVSYDNNPEFFGMNRHFASQFHEVNLTKDWDKIPLEAEHWGVAFVDHAPAERRKIEIARLSEIADYIVVHDTEPQNDSEYGFIKETFPLFKYRYDYNRQKPYTTVLSNFIDFHH